MQRQSGISVAVMTAAAILFSAPFTGCAPAKSGVELTDPPVLVLSADQRTIAWAQRGAGGRAVLSVNGKSGDEAYDLIDPIVMSPDGSRIAYGAGTSGVWRMMLDGRRTGPECEAINPTGAAFCRDGRRFAFGALIKGRWHAVVDGEPASKEGFDYVGAVVWSPDGTRFAHMAGRDGKRTMVTDGRPGRFYDEVGDPVWSPDGKHLAYAAAAGVKKFIVLDGVAGEPWDETGNPAFSFNGRRLAYSARRGNACLVIADGRRVGGEYPMESLIDPLVFAPADERLAFGAYNGKNWVVVIDGKEGPGYVDVLSSNIMLGPDGRGYAYPAASGGGWIMVRDGREGPAWERIVVSGAAYGPDGARFVYAGRRNGAWRLVVDGVEGPALEYDEISAEGGPGFSPDGGRVVFKARRRDRWRVVVDGRAGPAYDRVYKPVFTGEGVEYLAERKDTASIVRCFEPYPETAASAKPSETRLAGIPAYPMTETECAPCKEKARQLLRSLEEE